MLAGAILAGSLFNHFDKLAIALPALDSAAMIVITIAMRWKLKGHVWFWITMFFLAAIHVPLILFIPWTDKWIPAFVIIPVGIADSYAMLRVVAVVGKLLEGQKPKAGSRRSGDVAR